MQKSFLRRLKALTKKEFLQLKRDNSSLLIGLILPIILIIIIGSGISLDIKSVPIAVILEDSSPAAKQALQFMNGSAYFAPNYVYSMRDAELLMRQRKVDAILRVPNDFSARLSAGNADLQLIVYGVESSSSMLIPGYVAAGINQWVLEQKLKSTDAATAQGSLVVISRTWFNDANSSTWFFVPGLIVLIMTIVGVFLTALVMAREWERGTLEAMFVTPVKPAQILLAKIIPYFCVAIAGLALCILIARFFYQVPIHGSIWLIVLGSTIYLLAALGMGLVISSLTKNQFLASQMALIISYLPAVMLSGFLFDLHNVPLVVRIVGQILPATYYMELLKTLFLAGNNWPLIIKNCAILLGYAVLFQLIALKLTPKRIA